jgi:hypothetical protein
LKIQLKARAVYLSFLSDGLQTFWFGKSRKETILPSGDENA